MSFALDVALPADVADNAAALADFELDRLRHFRLFNLKGGDVIQPAVSPEAEAFVRAGGVLYGYAGLAERGATAYAIYRWTLTK